MTLAVLVVTPDFPPSKGGIQRLLMGLLMNARDLDPLVVAPLDGVPDESFGFSLHPTSRAAGSRRSALRLNVAAARVGLARPPDVILSGHVVASPAAVVLKRALRRPLLQYLYGVEMVARPRVTRFAARQADASIALSAHARDVAIAIGAPAARVRVIPPGVAPVAASARPKYARPTIVTVARLAERYKGHDVMLRALALVRGRFPRVQWIVIGDGPLRGHLGALARAQGLERSVAFAGEVEDGELARILERAHVFAMPSRLDPRGAGEGFGIAYLEAAQRGLPVVAGDVGGARDAVVHGRTGLLVDPTDPAAVADAVSAILGDPALAGRLGREGRRYAQLFLWPRVAERVESLLFELCDRHARPRR